MTYEESINNGYTNSIMPTVDGDRMVWVLQYKFDKDVQDVRGPIAKPTGTFIYDAETDDNFSSWYVAEGYNGH